jgi:DNA modification methylase
MQILQRARVEDIIDNIYCGDAEVVLQIFPDSFIDLIVTSPPYNFGQEYDTIDDSINWSEYFDKLERIWRECKRVLKSGGRICINIQPLFSEYLATHHIISNQLRSLGLLWKGEIIWDKSHYACKYTAWGSWKSPSNPYLKYTWELIEIFCKDTYFKYGDSSKIDLTPEEFKTWVNAWWRIQPETRMQEFGHPAMFPEEIPYRLIKLFSYKGDIILDPFNGAGTTTLVAKKLDRHYIGIDISKRYCEIAERRIKEYIAQKKMLEYLLEEPIKFDFEDEIVFNFE